MNPEEFERRFMAHLNEQQKAAVRTVDGPVLLLAVPGSGKTTVLVTRLGYLIYCKGIAPSQILTMTYTQAATEEMRQRFVRFFGGKYVGSLKFCTINSLSLQIIYDYGRKIGRPAFELLEEGGTKALISELYRQINREYATPSAINDIKMAVSYVKNQMLTAEEIKELKVDVPNFPELYDRYCAALRGDRHMDFDDQMVYAKTILETNPDVLQEFRSRYPYLCVDESQDTSRIQHAIIRLLASGSGNLFMVGDEDQSIYGFRAAYPDALMRFEQDYPGAKVLLLEENYRSTPEILDAANGFIQMNLYRRAKTIRATRSSGSAIQIIYAKEREIQYDYLLEAARDRTTSAAVLYRNNDSALPLIDLLDAQGMPYSCKQMEDTFFTNRLVMDIADIACFAWEPENRGLFLAIYYKLGCGISKAAAIEACQQSEGSGKPILYELLRQQELPKYVREAVTDLMKGFLLLKKDSALYGLSRIWNSMGYEKYAKERGLDRNKYRILCALARRQPSLQGLFQRIAQLRNVVERPRYSPNGLVLSTIHSSKGLEYDTVYLLDVLDGILPADAKPRDTEEDQRQYQEERRLFYVAMTRAKNHLYLFACSGCDSEFLAEILRELPQMVREEDDVFASIRGNLCGKSYCHRENGPGEILANCENECLIGYENGKHQLLSMGQMLAMRKPKRQKVMPVERKTLGKRQPAKKEQKKQSIIKSIDVKMIKHMAREGRAMHHRSFGHGLIVCFQDPYVTILFSKDQKDRVFDLVESVQKGLLKFL